MPFCTQCGNSLGDRDQYCGSCGAPQPAARAGASAGGSTTGTTGAGPRTGTSSSYGRQSTSFPDWNPRTASILCYIPVLGWIPCLVVLATDRFRHDHDTRFHAFQGLYLFIAWLMVDWVVQPLVHMSGSYHAVSGMLKAVLFGAWIWMLVKVMHHESYKLPFLGDLAEKSVAEQR
jgi:uncharacterized membrane protein